MGASKRERSKSVRSDGCVQCVISFRLFGSVKRVFIFEREQKYLYAHFR